MEGRMVSPNELMAAAKDMQLQGREPVSREDWYLIVNFIAANIAKGMPVAALKLFKLMYSIPLDITEIEQIWQYQEKLKI